jgi:hypothetical protein
VTAAQAKTDTIFLNGLRSAIASAINLKLASLSSHPASLRVEPSAVSVANVTQGSNNVLNVDFRVQFASTVTEADVDVVITALVSASSDRSLDTLLRSSDAGAYLDPSFTGVLAASGISRIRIVAPSASPPAPPGSPDDSLVLISLLGVFAVLLVLAGIIFAVRRCYVAARSSVPFVARENEFAGLGQSPRIVDWSGVRPSDEE